MIGDDFEAGAQLAGVEGNGRFLAQSSFALARPRRIRIAHDFANVFVEQQCLDGPKEWKDQFEAHSGNLTAMEAQRIAGLPSVKRKGLCSRFLLGRFIVILIFRGGLFGAVQLQDRSDPNFPDALLFVRLLALVLPAAQFAFHLDMCALGERLGKLRELAEDDATVPFGVRDVLAILLVGGLGCQRKSGDAEIRVVGASFWVAAEEADEGYFVLVHDCLRLLNLPILAGAPLSEWAMLPSAEALHLRRVRRNLFGGLSEQDLEGNRNPQGGAAEAEERAAAGRMKRPEAVPEQRRDT